MERVPRCQIVQNAIVKVSEINVVRKEKGLDSLDARRVFCPFERMCNGSDCAWAHAEFKPIESPVSQTDKLVDKLQKRETMPNKI